MKKGNGKPPQIIARDEEKDYIVRRQFMFRLNIFFFAAFVMFGILIVRLAVLQFIDGPELKLMREDQGTRDVSIPPFRGNILDSDKKPIAYSTSTQTLTYTLQAENNKQIAIDMSVKLSKLFKKYNDDPEAQMTPEEIQKQMDLGFRTNTISVPRRIRSDLSNAEIAFISENKDQFIGVDIVEESVRNYSEDRVASQLVGYLKKYKSAGDLTKYKEIKEKNDPATKYLQEETVGFDGLEYMYQEQLRGTNGLKTYPVDRTNKVTGPPVVEPPQRGNDLVLSINRSVQVKTQEAIMKQLDILQNATSKPLNAGNEATMGFAVAMEVDTGKVISMASMPDYDTNIWKGGSATTEKLDPVKNFITNGTVRTVYPDFDDKKELAKHTPSLVYLGSVQKPLSVLIGLNEGLFTANEQYRDIGYYEFGAKGKEVEIDNASRKANGYIDARQSLAKSSNAYMMEMVGERLLNKYNGEEAIQVWDNYMKQFGLGVKTGSDLPYEQAGVEDYFHEAKNASNISAMARASFGQMGKYTTLQLAQYTTMLANKGKRLKPLFVSEILDPKGKVVEKIQPEVLNKVSFPDSYWNTIYDGMSQVRVQGFEGVDYSFLRKTGTSQQQVAKGRMVENAVFIAFAPADKPKLAVAIVIPEGGFGGYGAAPVARQIFDAYDEAVGLYGTPKKSSTKKGD
ncbi:peptidoglycan D,D-transpeptidase FtsI family protein [Paenibacillus herberti]|uniref:Cell division protein FtsI n=1 Tax=Paenibacillus herberti TaxID=1619309 RepID=A0A229P1R3_9BACL|nr:penicillin-binding transpeptidase domain-containing protein [Paenibacillus herberti]OXM16152.1 cell division protein FtsI [Paenibacillus herberti]